MVVGGGGRESGDREYPGAGRGSASLSLDLEEECGGILRRLRSDIDEATERVEGPGLEGRELSVLSESRDEMVRPLPLDFDCIDLDRRI